MIKGSRINPYLRYLTLPAMSLRCSTPLALFLIFLRTRCIIGSGMSNFTTDGVIPDVITRAPARVLRYSYDARVISLGEKLSVQETSRQPQVDLSWTCALTSLLMVDPDAPSRVNPTERFWRHWFVVNIPPKCGVLSGDVITSYAGPDPPKGTGHHRYVFLVYSQNASIDKHALNATLSQERGKFNLTLITSLRNISTLEAAAYFFASNGDTGSP
ncbi:protein D1-like isoform X2 [Ornithodoros turicata]|uniref:protein D1-like isoform X2 n=1 Tax=Ornithodoros turicata TaxID=34597 RepID=UPI0031397BDF